MKNRYGAVNAAIIRAPKILARKAASYFLKEKRYCSKMFVAVAAAKADIEMRA